MITAEIKQIEKDIVQFRRDFHKHPELGTQEHRTSRIVEEYLHSLGIRTERMFDTGVVGYIEGSEKGKTVLLRADMDALPMSEENECEYKSENEGVMHACGHDAHTAMLMGTANVLMRHVDQIHGTVKLVFQPNEEDLGAYRMVEEGVLENPKVDASFALHVMSLLPVGSIGLKAGPVTGEMYAFKITLNGKGGHTSTPQKGMDPILCAAHIIEAVQMIQSREVSPMEPTCIAFGRISGGTVSNVIPDTVELEGSLRYMYDGSDEGEQHPRKRMQRIVDCICAAHRIQGEITFTPGGYVTINDPGIVSFLTEEVLPGMETQMSVIPYEGIGGDDFSEFANCNGIPGAYILLGTGNQELGIEMPLHSSNFNIDEKALAYGVELLVNATLDYLK